MDRTEFDFRHILERLPHRYPFLMVDRVRNLETGRSISAIKNVTMNEPHFSGHFPENPVMPGVLVLEAIAQAGCILAFETWGMEESPEWLYMTGMDDVRFRKKVRPGDRLDLEVEIIRIKKKAVKMYGKALVDGEIAAEAQFMAMAGDSR
jgi:3-hydroxyacyl-[acyl-carrier-protein] dehydratase